MPFEIIGLLGYVLAGLTLALTWKSKALSRLVKESTVRIIHYFIDGFAFGVLVGLVCGFASAVWIITFIKSLI